MKRQIAVLFFLISFMSPLLVIADEVFFTSLGSKYQNVLVQRVLNINTIELSGGERIRLIGIKPQAKIKEATLVERDKNGFIIQKEEEPFLSVEEQGLVFLRREIESEKVRIEFDQEKRENGFTLGYVFRLRDNLLINQELLRQGFAELQIRVPNLKYADLFRAAYKEAKFEQRGLLSR